MAEPASVDYFDRIDNAQVSRHFTARIDAYFDGDAAAPTSLTGGMLSDYKFKREMAAEDTFPLGRVSCSTLSVNLNNALRYFTFTNTASPYYGKLKTGTKCILYTSLQLADGSYEEKRMGTVYTSDWDVTSNEVTANLVCYDRLYFLRKKKVPKLPVFINTTVAKLFTYLFQALGLKPTEYIVDSALEYSIPYGWIPGTTVDEALQALTQAGMCTIYVDRYDRIVTALPYKRLIAGRILSAGITGNSQIKSINQLQAAYKAYTGVSIEYYNYSVENNATLALLSDQKLEVNANEFLNVAFTSSPALKVTGVYAKNTRTSISTMSAGATSMDITLTAAEASSSVDIEVVGNVLKGTTQSTSFTSGKETTERAQDNKLEMSSVLMQSTSVAKAYGNKLCQIITDEHAYITADLRGDLTFDIGDVYVFNDPRHDINEMPFYLTRIELNFNGALSCSVACTKYDSLAVYEYAYLGPGFSTKILKNL